MHSSAPSPAPLVDSFQRQITYLRLSVTDRCDLRCTYCMPEDMRFLPPKDLLSIDEIEAICLNLNAFGVDELRLTGGEPLLRHDFDAIVQRLARISWSKWGLTTNALLLESKLPLLDEMGLKSINVSLDSLNPDRFASLTRRGKLEPVLQALRTAQRRGFSIKINCIVFRSVNDDEWEDFIRFSEGEGIEVRFLELMKVGPGYWDHEERFVPVDHMLEKLQRLTDLTSLPVADDSTSFVFRTAGGGKIGFIASESKPFCNSCSRLRLSAKGQLRACLFSEEGIMLKGMHSEDYPELLRKLLPMKPAYRLDHIHQPMNQIGG